MISMSNFNFLEKEDYATWTYVYNRMESKTLTYLGREYTTFDNTPNVTFVGKAYKVKDKNDGSTHYFLMCGMAKQHPYEKEYNKTTGIEIAYERALIEPFLTAEIPSNFTKDEFKRMMMSYANALNLSLVQTTEERKYYEKHVGRKKILEML